MSWNQSLDGKGNYWYYSNYSYYYQNKRVDLIIYNLKGRLKIIKTIIIFLLGPLEACMNDFTGVNKHILSK